MFKGVEWSAILRGKHAVFETLQVSARGPTSALPVLQDPTGTYQPSQKSDLCDL